MPGVKIAQRPTITELTMAFTVSAQRNPNVRKTIGIIVFMPSAPNTLATVISPDWKAVKPKPSCRNSGRRNGMQPTPAR